MSRNLTECGCGPIKGDIRNGKRYPYGMVTFDQYEEDQLKIKNQIETLAGRTADDINAANIKIANQNAAIEKFKSDTNDRVNVIETGIAVADNEITHLKSVIETSVSAVDAKASGAVSKADQAVSRVNSLEVVVSRIQNQHLNDVNNLSDRIDLQANASGIMRVDIQNVNSNVNKIAVETAAALAAINERLANMEGDEVVDILSFTASPNICEIGGTENIVLTWIIRGTPAAVTLNGRPVTGNQYTAENVQSDTEFILSVTSEKGIVVTKKVSVSFVNHIYYGKTSDPVISRSTVKGLAFDEFTDDVTREITVKNLNDEYVIYAYPKRLGPVEFKCGALYGGFEEPVTVSVDNHSEYSEDYYVYRSVQQLTGTANIEVRAM